MSPQLFLVTGANTGIGFGIAKQLVLMGHHVILGCRSEERAMQAISKIEEEFKEINPSVRELMDFIPVDLEHQESFERASQMFESKYKGRKLAALINNAGITINDSDSIAEQAMKTMKVNYYGSTKFTELFLKHVEDGGRVVFLGSRAGSLSFVKNDEIKEKLKSDTLTRDELKGIVEDFLEAAKENKHEEKGYPENIYGMTKAAVNNYARCLAHEDDIKARKITVNACCPGFVKTAMTGHDGQKCVEEGADTPVWLATSKDVAGVSGKFFGEREDL